MICRFYGAYRNLNTGNYKDFAPTEHVIVRAVLLGDGYRGLRPWPVLVAPFGRSEMSKHQRLISDRTVLP